MGEKAFIKNQWGLETSGAGSAGVAVAADSRFLGAVSMPKDRTASFPEDVTGLRVRSTRAEVYQILVDGLTMNMDNAYYQVLPMLFSVGLKGSVTPAEQTTDQNDYLWDFTPSLTGSNSLDSITLETGDDTQAYEIEYVMARRYVINGKMGDDSAVTIETECFGKQITPTTFTGSIALPTVEGIIANNTKLYVDNTWATLGNTQKTGLLKEFSLEILTGNHPKFHGNGKTFDTTGQSYIDFVLTLTLEGNSDADGYFDGFRAETPYAIRLEIPGSQIGTGDTHNLVFDLYGVFEEVIPMGSELNGNNLHTAIFRAIGDDQSTVNAFAAKVTTNVSAI